MNQFAKKLYKLENSREDIMELKTLAESIPESSKQVNDLIVASFKTASNDKKLALLYVMDALLKSNKDIYLKLFEEKIAELFCDVYENSVKATKHKLVLTYYSWEPFFSGQTMKKIQFLIRKKTGDEVEKLLTEEDLKKLIDYYEKNSIDPSHLEMALEELRSNQSKEAKMGIKKKTVTELPPKEVINKTVPVRTNIPVQNDPKNYKIPKKDNRMQDRDDSEIQIKKKVTIDSGNMLNMMDNYGNDSRTGYVNNPVYDNRGMRQMGYNNVGMGNDPYNTQPNMMRNQNIQNDNFEATFSDDEDIPISKNKITNPQNAGMRNDPRGYNPNINQNPIPNPNININPNVPNVQNNPPNPINTLNKNIMDVKLLVDKFKNKTTVADPRQAQEQKPRVEQQPVHYERSKTVDMLLPTLSNRKSSEYIEQPPALLFKSLLRMLKLGLFQTLVKRYNRNRESLYEISRGNQMKVLDSLYKDIPYQCTTCALRFTHSTLLNKHLDWHFKTNREFKNKKENMKPRQPLLSIDNWLRDEGSNRAEVVNEEKGKDDFVFENYVLSDGDSKNCKACGETFKEIWDKEKESWVLDGAVKAKYEGGNEDEDAKLKKKKDVYDLMHFRCYKLVLDSESNKNL